MINYHEVFEQIPDGVTLHDPVDGTIIDTNQRFCEMLGYSREELLSLDFEALHADEPPYTSERAAEHLRTAVAEGPQTFEWLDETKDGQPLPVEVTLSQTVIEGEERVLAVVRDIRDRKHSEQRLERYETLVETVGDPMYMLDQAGNVEMVNEAMVDTLGAPRETLVGRHASSLMSEGDFERGTELIQELLACGDRSSVTYAVTVVPVSGERFPAEVNLGVLLDDAGRYQGTTGIVRDVSDHVAMTEQLESQKAQIQNLHGAAHALVDSRGVDEVYQRTVQAAEQVLNFEMCSTMIFEDGWLVPKAVSSDAPAEGARPMRPDEGTAGRVFQTGQPIITDDIGDDDVSKPAKSSYRSAISVPIGGLGVFQAVATEPETFTDEDVEMAELLLAYTESVVSRIRFEEELEHKNEHLDQFAEIVSHDLRNPLNVATGRLELARADGDSDHFDAIARAHERMDVLIDDLLSLARAGESIRKTKPVELADLVQGCWRTVDTGLASLTTTTETTVLADESRLRQLLENLVRNAVEHGGDDVAVTIGDLDDGFFIEDDGPGIPEADRGKIFEAGYSSSPTGTGFGLNIVKQVANAHGWEIEVGEGAEGGARFEITGVQRE